MRGAWVAIGVLAGAGCGFDGGQGGSADAPPGTPDAPDIDADPGAPDAPPDAMPGAPDAAIDARLPDGPLVVLCPGGYLPIPNGATLYRFVGTGDDWLAAEQDCEDDDDLTDAGTHLVVFDNSAEKQAVDTAFNDDFWIGISDRNDEGQWIAVNGQANPVTGGLGGGDTGKNCARVKDSNGAIEAQQCTDTDTYVCECDGLLGDPANY
jgi:hypothetical protein